MEFSDYEMFKEHPVSFSFEVRIKLRAEFVITLSIH